MSTDLPPNACLLVLILLSQGSHGQAGRAGLPSGRARAVVMAEGDGLNPERTSMYPPSPARQDRWLTAEDLRITQYLRDGLARAVMDSNPADIRISTRNGVVTLNGPVKNDSERHQIADLVHATPGATHFNNALEVR